MRPIIDLSSTGMAFSSPLLVYYFINRVLIKTMINRFFICPALSYSEMTTGNFFLTWDQILISAAELAVHSWTQAYTVTLAEDFKKLREKYTCSTLYIRNRHLRLTYTVCIKHICRPQKFRYIIPLKFKNENVVLKNYTVKMTLQYRYKKLRSTHKLHL